jgi:hypothetical protein
MGQFTIPKGVMYLGILPTSVSKVCYHLRDENRQLLYAERCQQNMCTLIAEPEFQEFYGVGGLHDRINLIIDTKGEQWYFEGERVDPVKESIEFMLRTQRVLAFKDELEQSGLLDYLRRHRKWTQLPLNQIHLINLFEEQNE